MSIKVGDEVVNVDHSPRATDDPGVGTVIVANEDSFFAKYTVRWANGTQTSVTEGDIAPLTLSQ